MVRIFDNPCLFTENIIIFSMINHAKKLASSIIGAASVVSDYLISMSQTILLGLGRSDPLTDQTSDYLICMMYQLRRSET